MVLPKGYADDESAAAFERTFDPNESAMQLDQFLHQSQADACSFMRAAAGVRHSMKPLEESRDCFRRYAYSRILNSELCKVANPIYADADFSLEGEFESVGDEIQNNLLPHVAINIDGLPEVDRDMWEKIVLNLISNAFK